MPIYDYRCTSCGSLVEVLHGINEQGPATCAACGGAMRKALSPPAIVFKGSGWAKKDARAAPSGTTQRDAGPRKERETSGDDSASAPARESSSSASSTAGGNGSTAGADRPTAASSSKGKGE